VTDSKTQLQNDLLDILASRRWHRHFDPFPHVVAEDVFTPQLYGELETWFTDLLALELGEAHVRGRLSRNMAGYDAYGYSFQPPVAAPFAVFFSPAWRDLLANLFAVDANAYVSGGLHHHRTGSANGKVHNDLNPGWFTDDATDNGIIVSNRDVCHYGTGRTRGGGEPREVMRAIAMLFYLGNPDWAPGDGGETGLYRSARDAVDHPAATVAPRNNSLLAFECTPRSFHAFLSNRRAPRNCLTLWLHRDKQDVLSRWGEREIVYWNP
jgi:2OG-Fe(II) oxygenase superfamily